MLRILGDTDSSASQIGGGFMRINIAKVVGKRNNSGIKVVGKRNKTGVKLVGKRNRIN